jgi:hypothetical protein
VPSGDRKVKKKKRGWMVHAPKYTQICGMIYRERQQNDKALKEKLNKGWERELPKAMG